MRFHIGGCRVTVSFLFTALLAFLFFYDKKGTSLSGLVAAACHELGHLLAMSLLGRRPSEIRFAPFGVEIVKNEQRQASYQQDVFVSLAGPAANLLCCALCLFVGSRDSLFFQGNLILAAMNLIPIESLDGGQALFSFLCQRTGDKAAARLTEFISFLFLLPLACASFLLLFQSKYNISLLLVTFYLMALLVKKGRFF